MNRQNYSDQVERAAQELEQYARAMTGMCALDLRPMLAGWEAQSIMERYTQAQARPYPPSVGKRR